MYRRSAACGESAASSPGTAEEPEEIIMKKSINAWSVPESVDFGTMFRQVAQAGFDGIELNVDREGASAHCLSRTTTAEELAAVRALSAKYGLPVVSISSSLYGGLLGSDDEQSRGEGQNLLRSQLRCAKALGADGILVVPGGVGEDCTMARAYENAFRSLHEMKEEIEASGIFVGLENVWNGFFLSPFDLRDFIDSLGSKSIGAYFDVGNVAISSSPEHWIEILGGRIGKVHVKDFARTHGRNTGWFVNLLEGSIDWKAVMAALRGAGYDGCLTAELDIMRQSPEYLYEITSSALDVILAK